MPIEPLKMQLFYKKNQVFAAYQSNVISLPYLCFWCLLTTVLGLILIGSNTKLHLMPDQKQNKSVYKDKEKSRRSARSLGR
ncbi:MAG: hypothetical protein PVG60_00795, partial [Desulfarculaceae bacterium]